MISLYSYSEKIWSSVQVGIGLTGGWNGVEMGLV